MTLFHKASSPASVKTAMLLKQVSANVAAAATADQVGDAGHQTRPRRDEFELNITEDPPTADQLPSIIEYVGAHRVGAVVEGARSEKDALRLFKQSPDAFKRPVVRPGIP